MPTDTPTPLELLRKKYTSEMRMLQLLEELKLELGTVRNPTRSNVLAAIALIRLGGDPEKLARGLGWGEFEDFCANILRASGFEVVRNVMLKRPRMQIDILAESGDAILSIDCKHWRRSAGDSALSRFASNQLSRTVALREKVKPDGPPIASLILTMTAETSRFVGGVAIVPVSLLRSFLNTFYGFQDHLRMI